MFAKLGRLLVMHGPLQAALVQDLPLQRDLLRFLLRLVVPPAGAPETMTWVGDVEAACHIVCSPGLTPAFREHAGSPQGLRTLQAALRLLQQPLPELFASQQADAEQLEEAQHAVSKHTARVALFATLACAALEGSAGEQRATAVACLMAEGQQAAAAAVRGWRALLNAPGSEVQQVERDLGPALGAVIRAAFAVDTGLFQGRRGLQAAHSGLYGNLSLVWQLLQLDREGAERGAQRPVHGPAPEGAAAMITACTLRLAFVVAEASCATATTKASAASATTAGGLAVAEHLHLVWQAHTAACCLVRSMSGQPAANATRQMMLMNACSLVCQLLRAASNLVQQCTNGLDTDTQR